MAPLTARAVESLGLHPEESLTAASVALRKQLPEEIASHIRGLIMSGQVVAGEYVRLDRIADELGVSVTPVREALLALRGEGFVRLEANRGFRVAALSKEDVADLFFVQKGLAGELAARAALSVDRDVLEQIELLQQTMQEMSRRKSWDEIDHLNFEFHRLINNAADAPKLSWFLSLAVRYVPHRFHAVIRGWSEASLNDHAAIIDALYAHDCRRAREAMSRHIAHAGELLIVHLENQGFWSGGHEGESTSVARKKARSGNPIPPKAGP